MRTRGVFPIGSSLILTVIEKVPASLGVHDASGNWSTSCEKENVAIDSVSSIGRPIRLTATSIATFDKQMSLMTEVLIEIEIDRGKTNPVLAVDELKVFADRKDLDG